MTLSRIGFALALTMFTSLTVGCSSSSSSPSNPAPPAQDQKGAGQPASPGAPVSPGVPPGTSIEGKWMSACAKTSDSSLGVRSLGWSVEVAGNRLTQTEYNFEDADCKKVVASTAKQSIVEIAPAYDGSDAKVMKFGEKNFVMASYYLSADQVFFIPRSSNDSKSRINARSDARVKTMNRVAALPDFQAGPTSIADDVRFGAVAGQKMTYLYSVETEDKRPDYRDWLALSTRKYLIWLETKVNDGQVDVLETSAMTWGSDGFWENNASQLYHLVTRSQWTEIQTQCDRGQIQTVIAPWGSTPACVVEKASEKRRTVGTIGRRFVGLSNDYEFQNDDLFRQQRRLQFMDANY